MKRSKRAQRTKQAEWCFLIFKSVLQQNTKLSKRERKKNNRDKKKCKYVNISLMQ